jgi:hypothetical protein
MYTARLVSTLALQWSIIGVSTSTSSKREQQGSAIQFFFKHQYITKPQITPETLVIKAAAEHISALKGTVSQDAEMADALAKFSDLFHKIAAAKADRAKAKEKRNHHRTHPNSR